jgi:hypothetical protein
MTTTPPDLPLTGAAGEPGGSPTCANCGAPLRGHYCHECGAPRSDDRPLTVRRFARDAAHEVTSVDSTTLRTFQALFARPGVLTRDYLAGRTRWYLSPLRLFLVMWAAFLFSVSFYQEGFVDRRVVERNLAARRDSSFDGVLERSAKRHATSSDELMDQTLTKMTTWAMSPWLRVLDPIVVGGVLALLYRGRRRNYAEHVVFALHLLAFNSALAILTNGMHHLAGWDGTPNRLVSAFHWSVLGTYFFLAARLVHPEPRLRTGMKTLGFLVGSQVAMFVAPVLAGIAAVVLVMWR